MKHKVLWGLAAFYLVTGLYIAIAPLSFYQNAPGVLETGPYNMHFLRDVGFAFTVSALGIGFGLANRLKPLILFGSAWLCIHGVFHLVLWIVHPNHAAPSALVDLVIVVLPAALLSYLAASWRPPTEI